MKSRSLSCVRSVISFGLIVSLMSVAPLIVNASSVDGTAGHIAVSGKFINGEMPSVFLNGEKAFDGRAFFGSGVVETPAHTHAVISLGDAGKVVLSPASVISIAFDSDSITGTLSAGNVRVINREGVDVNIQAAGKTFANKEGTTGSYSFGIDAAESRASATAGTLYTVEGANSFPTQDDDDEVSDAEALVPILVLGGLVAIAALYVVRNGDDNDGAFVSGTS